MFYLGASRAADEILAQQRTNTRDDPKTIKMLHKLVELTKVLRGELLANNVLALGDILKTAWMYKRELSAGITNERVDHYFELAIRNGALGGKLLGAGGSGFLLLYVPAENHERLRLALVDLKEYPFRFDNIGSTIIYYE